MAAGVLFRRSRYELGDDRSCWSVQIEQAAVVEDHGHGRGGDDFGQRGNVEEGGGIDVKIPTLSQRTRQGWGTLGIICVIWVNEIAEGFECDEAALVREGD